jgi:hypothetical protein
MPATTPSYYNTNFAQPQQIGSHMRSNSWYAHDPSLNLVCNQNMGYFDQNQLIQNFAQMSLMNNSGNGNFQTNMGMNGNFYGNFEGHLSSIPPHMKQQKTTRSNSMSGMPAGLTKLELSSHNSDTTGSNPSHMNGFSLFNQTTNKASDNGESF